MMRSGILFGAALLLLLAAMAFKGVPLTLPEPPAAPPADRFDANRAIERLARVLGDERPGERPSESGLLPHPVDSEANDAVRARLIAELRGLGLEPRVTDDFACNGFERRRFVACARVRNVVATMGPADGPHLLLSSHYDSTSAGPGAGDAGIAVATLLETASLLRGRALRRPVTLLFNEGEEAGLIGARAFLERDPLAARIDALLNFEARGVTGPATMFETSRPNGQAIAHFARAADRPLANSLTTGLYKLIPNSTDVAVFEERDWTILNFAIIGNETRYHTAGDDIDALDLRSLQHMGDQALALTLDFATRDAPDAAGDSLYADLMGRQLVVLPQTAGLAALALLLVLFLAAAWSRRALARPLGAAAIGLFGAGGVALAGQAILSLIRDGHYWRGHPIVTEVAVYGSAMAACLVALLLVAPAATRGQLRAAFWLLFLAGGAGVAALAPGGAIFFLFPPLAVGIGIALARRWPAAEMIGAIAGAVILFLTFGPALELFEELMSNGPHWMFAPIAALILLPVLIELKPLMDKVPRIFVLAGAGDLFLLPWIAVALMPAYSEERQQRFTIEYAWDADAGSGRWAVDNDGAPVPFAADWERTELPYSMRKRWAAPAPALPVPAPSVEVTGRAIADDGRRVRLRLHANGAESVTLIAPHDAALRAAGTDGSIHPVKSEAGGPDDRYALRCVGRSCDGAALEMLIGRAEPVEFTIVGVRAGLPDAAAPLLRARPALARPQHAPDSTIAVARVRL